MESWTNYQSVLQLAAALNVGASALLAILGDQFRREERIEHLLRNSVEVISRGATELGEDGKPLLSKIASLGGRIADLEMPRNEQEARTGNRIATARRLFAGLGVGSVMLLILSSWPVHGLTMIATYAAIAMLIPIVLLSVWIAVRPDWLSARLKGPREAISIELADLGKQLRELRSGQAAAVGGQ